MDELDRSIIIELQKDPRQSNRRLAQSLDIDEHTVRRRIENLILSRSTILTVLPNLKMLGYPIRVYMLLEVEPPRIDEISKQLCQMSQFGFVSHCIGFAKFYVRGDFTSLEFMVKFTNDVLGKIPGIVSVETMIECQKLKNTYYHHRMTQPVQPVVQQLEGLCLNKIDRSLITQLQKNARAPLKELAQIVGVSQMTIHRRIKDLVNTRTIEYVAIPNIEDIGYSTISYARLQVKPDMITEVAKSISNYSQTHYVGVISGPTQILVGMFALSPQVISEFVISELSKIDGIVKIESFAFFQVLKQSFTWISE
jgi:Lrp/AsnC family transcriptional regulator for asnA, asnC and gidA